jgi:hypothetical protein
MKIDVSTTLTALAQDQKWFIARAGAVEGPRLQKVFAAWAHGVANCAAEIDTQAAGDAAIEQILQDLRGAIARRNLSRWRNNPAIDACANDIISELQDGIYAGENPDTVARRLAKRFGVRNYDWRRLARTEIASANAQGKLLSCIRNGFLQYNWVTAPGACAICNEIKARGPYIVGTGPLPTDDSHDSCLCTIHPLTSGTTAQGA